MAATLNAPSPAENGSCTGKNCARPIPRKTPAASLFGMKVVEAVGRKRTEGGNWLGGGGQSKER